MFALLAVLALYVVVGTLCTRARPRVAKSLVIPFLGTSALLGKGAFNGTSVEGSLRISAVMLLVVLVVTAGEPDLIMDRPIKAKVRRRLPKEARRELDRQERRTAVAQVSFIGCLIVFAVLVTMTSLGTIFA